MTDLSRFDGHTEGPWKYVSAEIVGDDNFPSILIENSNGEHRAITEDYDLIRRTPALLARVKELERVLGIVAENARSYPAMQRAVKEVLNEEWL